jgi:hypothetical protein
MAVYLHVTLELETGGVAQFVATMQKAKPVVEAAGWKLFAAFLQRTGRLNTAIDIWELEDMAHFDRGIQALVNDPAFAEIGPALAECVRNETVVFAQAAPFWR